MVRPRLTLLELMALVLFVGIILGCPPLLNEASVLESDWGYAVYLAVLVMATLAAKAGRIGASFFRGVAIYGWVYLTVALHFGLYPGNLAPKCMAALPMGALCGIASWYFRSSPLGRSGVDSNAKSA